MTKKRILILGAGTYQTRLIQYASSAGYEVHVASIPGPYPGIEIADYFHSVDTTDSEGILQLAIELQIDGILTTGSDVCVPSIGHVVDKLGLPGTGYEASLRSMDKRKMKQSFHDHAVPSPLFEVVTSKEEATSAATRIGFPCAIKAPDSSGSRGVSKANDESMVMAAVDDAFEVSRCGEIVIESWIEGEEFGAQAIVVGSELRCLMLHSDTVTDPPRRIPIGHGSPHPKENDLIGPTTNAVEAAVNALGIKDAICNVDLILTDEGPMILEIGARMGGTCIPEVCGTWWDVNLYGIALDLATGTQPQIPDTPMGEPCAAHLLWSEKNGIFRGHSELDEHLQWAIDIKEGAQIYKFTSGNLRIGDVIVTANTVEEAEERVSYAASTFRGELNVE